VLDEELKKPKKIQSMYKGTNTSDIICIYFFIFPDFILSEIKYSMDPGGLSFSTRIEAKWIIIPYTNISWHKRNRLFFNTSWLYIISYVLQNIQEIVISMRNYHKMNLVEYFISLLICSDESSEKRVARIDSRKQEIISSEKESALLSR